MTRTVSILDAYSLDVIRLEISVAYGKLLDAMNRQQDAKAAVQISDALDCLERATKALGMDAPKVPVAQG